MMSPSQDYENEKSPEDKKVSFAKRTTAKFRSMDLSSQSLNKINTKIVEADKANLPNKNGK